MDCGRCLAQVGLGSGRGPGILAEMAFDYAAEVCTLLAWYTGRPMFWWAFRPAARASHTDEWEQEASR